MHSPLLLIERVRLSDARPLALVTNLLALPPGATLTQNDLESDGLYRLLHARFGIELTNGSQRLSARLATGREAGLLGLDGPAALLSAHRVSFDRSGRGVEVSITLYTDETEISSPLSQ